ncbi:MAG: EAL domain-containing protein [Actinomycetales bacterium]|nr:EAL domain-containing protein [Actinomycetales bacterium]
MHGRAAVIGTVVLVVVLGGLMAGVLVAVAGVSARAQAVDDAIATLNAYQGVQRAIATEAFAEAAYRREPSEESRSRLVATIADLDTTVAKVYELGTPRDSGTADYLLILNTRYERLVESSLWQTGEDPSAGALVVAVGPALDAMQNVVDGAVARGARNAADAAAEQQALVRQLWMLAPGALASAILAIALCWAVILSQQAQFKARALEGERKALHDALTGLGNRSLLAQELKAELRRPNPDFALLMVDLDRFKEINDGYGHAAGDDVLRAVAGRLQEVSGSESVVCRMGGDEFAVLLRHASATEAVVAGIRSALLEPIVRGGVELRISGSVGYALAAPGKGQRAILTEADDALYLAKHYSEADPAEVAARLKLVQELRNGLDLDQFVVYYQPKVDLASGEVHDVEALVRWDHPTRGLVYPDAFIDVIEGSGLMPALTRKVVAHALDQVAAWGEQGWEISAAVNISPSALSDETLFEQVTAMLAARGLAPSGIRLELTEEFLMVDIERAKGALARFRDIGIEISVDDFGTGYSSLSYLRDLPIDELKLDRSFTFAMADDARAAALVAAAIALAHSLGLRMVAEGVESRAACDQLKRLGCDQAQGYYISRPVPAAELELWLTARCSAEHPEETPDATARLRLDRGRSVP